MPTSAVEFDLLRSHAARLSGASIAGLLQDEPGRIEAQALQVGPLYATFARQRWDAQAWQALLALGRQRDLGGAFVRAALADTDRRVGEDKPVAPSFLLACVLWQDVLGGWNARLARQEHPFPALQDAIDEVFEARVGDVSGRGKLGADMREIWMMQTRFEKRVGSAPFGLVEQPRFRAAFDFMRLRAETGEIDLVLADWWQEFSVSDDATREDLIEQVRAEQHKRPRAPRAHRAPGGDLRHPPAAESAAVTPAPESAGPTVGGDGGDPAEAGAVRKRRRRRRKPGDRRDGGAGTPAAES